MIKVDHSYAFYNKYPDTAVRCQFCKEGMIATYRIMTQLYRSEFEDREPALRLYFCSECFDTLYIQTNKAFVRGSETRRN